MPVCPQCTKPLAALTKRCPSCMADLDLLVEYVSQLEEGAKRAEMLTRAGELDLTVWAYLEVLEVDPDHAAARRQVGRVATAVRQFDRTAPGRRWLSHVRGEDGDDAAGRVARALRIAFIGLLLVLAFLLGYSWGHHAADETPGKPSTPAPKIKDQRDKDNRLMRGALRPPRPAPGLQQPAGADSVARAPDSPSGRGGNPGQRNRFG
jgi:hypothetical protein